MNTPLKIFLGILVFLFVSCKESNSENSNHIPAEQALYIPEIYIKNCSSCHGTYGDAKIAGAKDLTISTLTTEDIKLTIEQGKGVMPGFKGRLSNSELNEIVQYVSSLGEHP